MEEALLVVEGSVGCCRTCMCPSSRILLSLRAVLFVVLKPRSRSLKIKPHKPPLNAASVRVLLLGDCTVWPSAVLTLRLATLINSLVVFGIELIE